MKNGGLILWNSIAICGMLETSWRMGKFIAKSDSENHLKAKWFLFGAMVDHHPISTPDQSRLHQFGKKVLPMIFLGYALIGCGIWKVDILIADIEELEKVDASEIYPRRINAEELC